MYNYIYPWKAVWPIPASAMSVKVAGDILFVE